jgi:threonine dehydratase
MLSLSNEERARGVIAVSSGNHGRAVAAVAAQAGICAVICLAETVARNKVEAIRRTGAEVVLAGQSYDEASARAGQLQRERGLTFIHPFDDPCVIAGQGTIGIELLEDLPDLDTAIVPLSGGGLISGIALALKAANPAVRVIGVSMERAPVMVKSLRAGGVLELAEEPTLADALVGGIAGLDGMHNAYTFHLCQQLVDQTVLVSEEEIAAAMAFLLEAHHLVVEGGGAVGVAALLTGKAAPGPRTAVILSGGNVDIPRLLEIAQHKR